ncbi:LCP family protein [Dietzia cercidiphylli]|uniref:LCP family protein n=1 Tax=Dietzia cercidiphylli TaxID=498199 RepID=UPI003F7EDB00
MSRTSRAFLGTLVALAVLCCLAAVGFAHLERRADRDMTRVSAAFPSEAARPPAEEEDLTILLLGQDWHPETQRHGRSDAVLLVRIPAHRSSVDVVSIPRDSWVSIPGHGEGKINAALILGGPSTAVATVEELTGIRIDHVMMIDGDGFRSLTDAMGGVSVEIPETVHDSARDITWVEGTHHLDGAGALDYVGQRYGLPNGDLDRVRRHQYLLRALASALMEDSRPGDPLALFRVIDAMSGSLAIDEEWSMDGLRELAFSLRYLTPSDLTFVTAPVSGPDQVDGQSVIRLDPVRGAELWTAVRGDWAAEWADREGAALNGPVA